MSIAVTLLTGCSDGPFVIGELGLPAAAYCPAGQDCEGRLELRYGVAGTAAWGDRFVAGRVARAPALLLRGEDASGAAWPARTGGTLGARGEVRTARRGPFTDATRAAEGSFASEGALVRLGPGELAIEVVLRATASTRVLDVPGAGLALDADDAGRLTLTATTVTVSTEPLVEGAWYHALFVLRPTGARVYVNGAPLDGPGGSLSAQGDHAVRVAGSIAWLAVVPLEAGELDASGARERFARLTGVAATLAGGEPVPTRLGRRSVAFTDLVEDAGARRLHLVGERWPRVACRPSGATPPSGTLCGYLAEGVGHRTVPLELRAWTVDGSVSPQVGSIGDGVPAVEVAGSATLSTTHTGDDARRVLSVWARGSGEVVLTLEAVGSARCAPSTGSVEVLDGDVVAGFEGYGDGWGRCSMSARAAPTRALAVSLSATSVELAGPQVDQNRLSPSSLVLDDRELDELAYAGAGNVPPTGVAGARARVLVSGEELHDRSVLGLDGGSEGTSARLYVQTPDGTVVFAGFVGGGIAWNAHTRESVLGAPTTIDASWGDEEASVGVGEGTDTSAVAAPLAAEGIEQVTVGDAYGSGALNGLLLELTIGPR